MGLFDQFKKQAPHHEKIGWEIATRIVELCNSKESQKTIAELNVEKYEIKFWSGHLMLLATKVIRTLSEAGERNPRLSETTLKSIVKGMLDMTWQYLGRLPDIALSDVCSDEYEKGIVVGSMGKANSYKFANVIGAIFESRSKRYDDALSLMEREAGFEQLEKILQGNFVPPAISQLFLQDVVPENELGNLHGLKIPLMCGILSTFLLGSLNSCDDSISAAMRRKI